MKQFDLHFAHIRIIDPQTVLFQAKEGVEIDAAKSLEAHKLIQQEIPSEYGIIIDRKADYSIVPIEVYRTMNEIDNLKAVAIVLNGKRSSLPENTEKNLFKGKLEIFQTIPEAHQWISSAMTK